MSCRAAGWSLAAEAALEIVEGARSAITLGDHPSSPGSDVVDVEIPHGEDASQGLLVLEREHRLGFGLATGVIESRAIAEPAGKSPTNTPGCRRERRPV